MSDRQSSADLGSSLEAALSAFTVPERDWERDARAIEARLASNESEPSDAALLLAPALPSEPGEANHDCASTTPLVNSGVRTQSLAELARRSVEKRQSSEREKARAQLLTFAEPARDDSGTPHAPNSAKRGAEPARLVAARAALEDPRSIESARTVMLEASDAKPRAWRKVALGIPALALAAGTLLWFQRPEPAPLVANASPTHNTTTSHAQATPIANAPVSTDQSAHAEGLPKGIDPNTLPNEPLKSGELPRAPTATVAVTAPASASAAKIALEGAPPGRAQVANVQPAPEAAHEKALPPDPALRPADSSGGELPVKPSTGAAQAALGAVMSGARHCVAGDEAPSSAVVVFGSDGRVQRVTVTGPSAGTSAAACIEAQLGRARVQPFAAANFSVSATVRPD